MIHFDLRGKWPFFDRPTTIVKHSIKFNMQNDEHKHERKKIYILYSFSYVVNLLETMDSSK